VPSLHQQRLHPFREDSAALVPGIGGAAGRNVGSRASFLVDETCYLEFAIGPDHRVRVDDELLGQDPDGGKLVVRAQSFGSDKVLNLLHQLEIEWKAIPLVDGEMKHIGDTPFRKSVNISVSKL
jgi:hypothetical protein